MLQLVTDFVVARHQRGEQLAQFRKLSEAGQQEELIKYRSSGMFLPVQADIHIILYSLSPCRSIRTSGEACDMEFVRGAVLSDRKNVCQRCHVRLLQRTWTSSFRDHVFGDAGNS